ncbi:hypothetical protein DM01DRAFT_1314786 [Hesseltinella vesiculosa]|uniref:Oxidized purine nucleoside triphosphate hydrolase n=1 Tax=Hesseltinella vesiculosa TaxID=101127 RepID=A0A1X2GY73_9FUNG|nr:hypothetical protein DM01DRAFT_1314786 [Hesseltinella vesiculosa]
MPQLYTSKKPLTLVFPIDWENKKILLGMKKRGFGVNKINGFGGKLEPGETVEQAAYRELLEESMVEAQNMIKVGLNMFTFEGDSVGLEVHVYLTTDYRGEPQETNEMRPEWYDFDKIPFEQMWTDDAYWLPKVLNHEKFVAQYHFAQDQTTILSETFNLVDTVPDDYEQ